MIITENEWSSFGTITCDVAIVGAGAAGIPLGLSLKNKGYSVSIFEGGGEFFSEESQNLYSGSVVDRDLPYGLQFSRMRFLGGSTNCWGAGCGIFGEKELLYRDWVSKSSWPIEYDVLVPFYKKASEFLELPDLIEAENKREKIIKGFDNPGLFYTKKRNFKNEFYNELKSSQKVNVFLQANFKNFKESVGQRIEKIEVVGLGNSSLSCSAKVMVLCCGGVENARLLLNSKGRSGDPIGNANDLVGRYFSDHPITPIASIHAPEHSILNRLERISAISQTAESEVLFVPSFKIPDAVQKQRKMLNSTVSFQMENLPLSDAALSAWALKKGWTESGFEGLSIDRVKDVLSNPVAVAQAMYQRAVGGSRFGMRIQMEQEPNFNSRVMLSKEQDRFGHYKTLLDWQFTELDRHTIDETLKYCSEIFASGKIGLLKVDPPIVDEPDAIPADLRGGQHHSGTTRMGINAEEGVVDRDLKVFGTSNLYVLGSSVMPTNSWVNPTFTIIALAFRLGSHIDRVLNER